MGIDVYLLWDGQSPEEAKAQYTRFSVTAGSVGYLREAYHGGPYATHELMPEAFEETAPRGGVRIRAALLRARLPDVLEVAKTRSLKVYKRPAEPEVLLAFEEFVALAERKEVETGRACRILASW